MMNYFRHACNCHVSHVTVVEINERVDTFSSIVHENEGHANENHS